MRQLMSAKAKKKKQEEIVVVRDFPEVFSDYLYGLPLIREIEFKIKLVPGAMPVAKSPYFLPPFKLEELSGQLKELQDKADVLSRKERVKPKRVRAINMTLQSSIKDRILAAQKEASDKSARLQKEEIAMYFVTKFPRTSSGHDTIWVIVDRLTKSAYFLPICEDYKMDRLARLYLSEIVARRGVPISIICHRDSRFTSRFWQSMQEALGTRRKPLEFSVGDYVLLKVSSWKGVVCFGKKRKLAPRFVGPFEIIEKVGPVAYMLDLPEELDGVHDTFHMSNLKKCLADPMLQVPLDEIRVDDKLKFVEEPVEIMKREFKKLKWSRIAIVKSMQEALGTRLDMSMVYHPQTDGQSEHTIQTLEDMPRACVLDFGGS
nr:hypothetical protein [Tanacetum cinerariifolium]